jgi:predicted signal transduction protein with EAL and GGDEF domain
MGKSLSLTVVAQGVETREQADFLREHACDEFQGFYFNKPMSAHQFTELLRAQDTGVTLVGSRANIKAAATVTLDGEVQELTRMPPSAAALNG